MREIKFRAWDKDEQEMIYGALEIKDIGLGEGSVLVDEKTQRGNELIWQQYTELKDKNGKEIHEGDVFSFHPGKEWRDTVPDNPCVVFWSDELCALMFYVGKREMATLLPPSECIEVIGNIYENPELLENK